MSMFFLSRLVDKAKGCDTTPSVDTTPSLLEDFGKPLKVCLMQVRGDWAWYAEALGVWQWNCKSFMCPFGKTCRDGPLSWHDVSLDAPWRATCRDHAQFELDMQESLTHHCRRGPSPFAFYPKLAQAPQFKWTMVKCDWMHEF